MPTAARAAFTVTVLLLVGFVHTSPVYAETATATKSNSAAAAKAQEPAVLKSIIAAKWRLANARAALPPVQVVHDEHLEVQDFIQYAYDGGALRLYVSPGPKGGDIFAVLVDTREPRYENFKQLAATEGYMVHHHGVYVLVVPLRPVSQMLFDKLKSKQWTEDELREQLGAASYNWNVHGLGDSGLTYVPQGLSFISEPGSPGSANMYQISAADVETEWEKEHSDVDLPPVSWLSQLDYAKLQHSEREGFAHRLFEERGEIDNALANGKRSPDGRFIAGVLGADGIAYQVQIVIREHSKPERRFTAPYFNDGFLWLNARTIVFMGFSSDLEFYAIDVVAGTTKLVTTVPDGVIHFGVSGPDRFWYKTAEGETHEVTVPGAKKPASK